MEQPSTPEQFNFENSPAREAYILLGATNPLELSNKYSEADQVLFKSGEWDYDNPDLITNKVKTILDSVDVADLTEDEKDWRQEIIWFWYHHAISCALSKHKDKESAKRFAKLALENQPENHPNQITKLLELLVNDKIEEAEEFAKTIGDEKDTADDLIAWYKGGELK